MVAKFLPIVYVKTISPGLFGRIGLWGFLMAGMEAARAKLTQIGPPRQDPTQFDLLIVGTPVWDGRMVPAVRTYLKQFQGRLPSLAFYCTAGGSNTKKTLEELAAFTGKQPLALLSLRRSAVQSGDYRVALMEFTDRIRSS